MSEDARARSAQGEWTNLSLASTATTLGIDDVHCNYDVEVTGGASANLDIISGGMPGQEVTIRNRSATAGIVVRDDGFGGVTTGANIRLESSFAGVGPGGSVKLRLNQAGTKWEQSGVATLQ